MQSNHDFENLSNWQKRANVFFVIFYKEEFEAK